MLKQAIMLADKSGLREKSAKKNTFTTAITGKSKYSDEDLIEMNIKAGYDYIAKLVEQGKATKEEHASLIRYQISKQNG